MFRIAIATPNTDVWSETFIAAHLRLVPGRVLLLSDGKPPRQVNGRPINLPTTPRERIRAQWEVRVLHRNPSDRLAANTRRLLRTNRIQVVLAEYGPMAASLVEICKAEGIPLVAHFHGYDAHVHEVAKAWGMYAELFEGAAAIIAVSRHMERTLVAMGAPADKVHYLPYGIDVSAFTPSRPDIIPPHLLAVGRFVAKKAPLVTLAAFCEVLKQHPAAELTMIGDGPQREACQQLIAAWGMQDRVHLPGVATPAEVKAQMQRSAAFVQHSTVAANGDSEGTPLAVLEAMACGLPIVATRHAGIADVVMDGQQGLLCDELDLAGMARNMATILNDPVMASAMGSAARKKVEMDHQVGSQVEKLVDILARVASRK